MARGQGGGYFLLGAAILGAAAAARQQQTRSPAPAIAPPAPPRRPPLFGYLYQHENEIAYRLKEGTSEATAREVGIFGSADKAREVARGRGLVLAWPGVKEIP